MKRGPPSEARRKNCVSVRAYRDVDLGACRRLWKELIEKHREIYADPTIGGDAPGRFFDDHLRRVGPKRIWVAVDGAKVVGFAGLLVEGEDAEIEPLVVTRRERGKGVGELLVKKAIAAASEMKGVRFVTVRPVARNKEALEFFRKQGLANVGRIELFVDLAGRNWRSGLRIHDLEYGY